MNLNDFESHVDPPVLSMGRECHGRGGVVSLELDEGEWIAQTEGDHEVDVLLSRAGDIIESSCDCAHDMGVYCKHEVAVFYAMKKLGLEFLVAAETAETENETRLDKAMEELMRDEPLQSNAKRTQTQELENARNLIRRAINAVARQGYVEYRNTDRAVRGADRVIEMIETHLESGNWVSAARLCAIVAEEMLLLYENCDDSGGYVGERAEEAISKLGEAARSNPCDEIFDVIFAHALDSVYDDWSNWRIKLLGMLVPMCGSVDKRETLEQCIAGQMDLMREKSRDTDREMKKLQGIQHDILLRFDGEEAAERYLAKNLESAEFRRVEIKAAIKGRNHGRAIDLCLEGERKDADSWDLLNEWRTFRYGVLEDTGDIPAQKELARTMAVEGNIQFYHKLKELCSPQEWEAGLQGLFDEMDEHDQSLEYAQILKLEGQKARLLAYCRRDASAIQSFYMDFMPEYEREVAEIFAVLIRDRAKASNSRNEYHEVCNIIRRFKYKCGSTALDGMVGELQETYARRPAFVDELKRVNLGYYDKLPTLPITCDGKIEMEPEGLKTNEPE